MPLKPIHSSSRLIPDLEQIKARTDYWNLSTTDFLLYHPKAALWMLSGMMILGTISLLIFAYFAYVYFGVIAAIIAGLVTLWYETMIMKQLDMVMKNKTLTLYDLYMKK